MMRTDFMPLPASSPGGATLNSQGREPLVDAARDGSPGGAIGSDRNLVHPVAPPGLNGVATSSRGLRPALSR